MKQGSFQFKQREKLVLSFLTLSIATHDSPVYLVVAPDNVMEGAVARHHTHQPKRTSMNQTSYSATSLGPSPSLPSHWHLRQDVDPHKVRALQEALGIHALTAHMLVLRGLESPELANTFLEPSLRDLPHPNRMKGMDRACHRIIQAIERKEHIVIYGDYDVDGVSSTSLLFLFLQELGVSRQYLHFYIPHRLEHGYGLQPACFPDIVKMGCQLMITVDCGISSRTEIDELNTMGIDVIVIDHHLPPEQLPDAYTILNPKQPACSYPDKNLAAVGVAYQLVIGLRASLRDVGYFNQRQEPNLLRYLDIVALGTIADIVPLQGVNRIIVHHGLRQLQKTQWPGLKALMQVSDVSPDNLEASHIGFRLGPRINAAGRLAHASIGVNLLCCPNYQEAIQYAHELDNENTLRKQLQESIYTQAQQLLAESPTLQEEHAIVLARPEWHLGVVGIVASKLLEQWNKPVILMALDQTKGVGKGSARSIPSFNIHGALASCSPYLAAYGGHKMAAGLTVSFEHLDEFTQAFLAIARDQIKLEDLKPHVTYDVAFDPTKLTVDLLTELQRLAPFGANNPEPLMIAHQVPISRQRKTKDGKHLQFTVGNKLNSIAFRQGDRHPLPSHVSIAYRPQFNDWRGQRKIQLNIQEIC